MKKHLVFDTAVIADAAPCYQHHPTTCLPSRQTVKTLVFQRVHDRQSDPLRDIDSLLHKALVSPPLGTHCRLSPLY